MSTSSSAPASDRDPVPTDDPNLKARMCVFIIMQKDGTPFNVTSVTEEDIVQICMTLGHIHPLGVLWYLATELVALFCMAEDMQQASCGAIKAMELHDELIAVKTIAPMEPHIKMYTSVGGGYPSKLQFPPSEEEDDTNSPTGNPQWYHAMPPGRAWWPCRPGTVATCGGSPSGDCTLWVACTPSNPQPTPWGQPSGSGNFDGDDQEVTFPRGEGWVTPRQPSPTPAPAWPDGGWVPEGPPPQLLRPVLANLDVGHLINKLALGLHLGTPRINTFSG